jgi:Protein of unknown function (DUF4238)
MITRLQHYVWQEYLEPWTTAKGKARQLWCLRRDSIKPFLTDTKNVGVERDFYRLEDLREGDADFVRWLAFKPETNAKLRELNEGWIMGMESFFELQRIARVHPKASERLLAELRAQMIEFQENQYSRLEGDAVAQLHALQRGDVSFFDDQDQAARFSYFLISQYFRTKAMRDRIRVRFCTAAEKERFERTWPILRYIYATNVGYSIFANRKTIKLQVLQAADGVEFIASDQPVINTYGAFLPTDTLVEELELFYPVSPSRAAVISGHATYQDVHGTTLGSLRTHYFNQAVEQVAYECLFARSEAPLLDIAPHFCSRTSPS